jgi:O-antigen/teichoic acid export membrane protein
MNQQRVHRGGVWIITSGFLLQQALAFVTSIVVARSIGAAEFGAFAVLRNLVAFLLTLTPLGLDLALLKHAAFFDHRPAAFRHEVARLRILIAGVNAAIVLIVYLGAGAWLEAHVYHFPRFAALLVVTLLGLPFAADLALLGAVYRAANRPGAFALMTNFIQPFIRLGGSLLLLALGWSTEGVVIANSAAYLASSVLVAIDRSRTRPESEGRFALTDWAGSVTILRDSLWMAVSLFVGGAMRSVDTLSLGMFVAAKTVGAYGALSTVAQLVQAYPFAASQTLGPAIARFYRDGDLPAIRHAMSQYLRSASIVGGFLFGGIAALGDRLDLLFGHSFHFQPAICFMLPLGWLISATLGPMGYSLSMTGRHRLELAILVTGFVVLTAGCLILVPLWGQIGAASAVVAAFAFINLVRFSFFIRLFGFVPGSLLDLLPPVSAYLLAIAARLALDHLLARSLAGFVLASLLYSALYGALVYFVFADAADRASLQRRASGVLAFLR